MRESKEEARLHSAKFLRQRKFFMALPLIAVPFVLVFMWALGMAGGARAGAVTDSAYEGVNLDLPGAVQGKDSSWNKLQYYAQAEKDSAKLRALLKNDPYRSSELATAEADALLEEQRHKGFKYSYDPMPAGGADPGKAEERVYEKLAELDRQLKVADQPKARKDTLKPVVVSGVPASDIERLEKMMALTKEERVMAGGGEMAELKEMLNTILDIQHPERVEERLKRTSGERPRQVFSVERPVEELITAMDVPGDFGTLLEAFEPDSIPASISALVGQNRFYGLSDGAPDAADQHAIRAVVHEDQTLVSGATVKLRLLEPVFIAGCRVPAGQFVYGQATLNGERLQVSIASVGYGDRILPVSLVVYDMDGMAGINIPGAITRDVAKRSAAQSMQGLGSVNSLSPSAGAQAVTAGLQMAQNLVGKTAKLVRVTVNAGYGVLLVDTNQKL